MAYQITFTKRFEKHFKEMHTQERKQLRNKLRLLSENPMHPFEMKLIFHFANDLLIPSNLANSASKSER